MQPCDYAEGSSRARSYVSCPNTLIPARQVRLDFPLHLQDPYRPANPIYSGIGSIDIQRARDLCDLSHHPWKPLLYASASCPHLRTVVHANVRSHGSVCMYTGLVLVGWSIRSQHLPDIWRPIKLRVTAALAWASPDTAGTGIYSMKEAGSAKTFTDPPKKENIWILLLTHLRSAFMFEVGKKQSCSVSANCF